MAVVQIKYQNGNACFEVEGKLASACRLAYLQAANRLLQQRQELPASLKFARFTVRQQTAPPLAPTLLQTPNLATGSDSTSD